MRECGDALIIYGSTVLTAASRKRRLQRGQQREVGVDGVGLAA